MIRHLYSKMSVKNSMQTLIDIFEFGVKNIIVTFDSKIYLSEFSISVRHLQVKSGILPICMKQLIDFFVNLKLFTNGVIVM